MPKPSAPKFDEELGRVEFEELRRIRRGPSNFWFVVMLLLVAAVVVWYFVKGKPVVYRMLHPPPKAEPESPAEPDLFIPGIDYHPEGDDDAD